MAYNNIGMAQVYHPEGTQGYTNRKDAESSSGMDEGTFSAIGATAAEAIQWELGNAQQRWGYVQEALADWGWTPGSGGMFQQAADTFREQARTQGLAAVEDSMAAKGRVFSGAADKAVAANEANATLAAMDYKLKALSSFASGAESGSTGAQLSAASYGGWGKWMDLLINA